MKRPTNLALFFSLALLCGASYSFADFQAPVAGDQSSLAWVASQDGAVNASDTKPKPKPTPSPKPKPTPKPQN
jgi:heme/copper-type cytochrome/quinol oxidase subunit 2